MTFKRFKQMLLSVKRAPEILRCISQSKSPMVELAAYFQLRQPEYPYLFKTPHGKTVILHSWEDLTTAWVVWYGKEYRVSQNDKYIIDAGANIGLFSLWANSLAPEAKILALEPFPTTFRMLGEMVHENNLADFITPSQAALSCSNKPLVMDIDESIPSHSRKTISSPKEHQNSFVEVPTVDLSACMQALATDTIDFFKIDIEGAEYSFIDDTAIEELRSCKRIGLEYHGNGDTQKLFSKLKDAGFSITYFPKKGKAGVVEFTRK